MTPEEVKSAFEELKSEGMDDNAILVALGKMFQNGDVDKDQLGALIHQLGYEFTEDFAAKDEEQSRKDALSGNGGEGEPEESDESDESDDESEDESDEPEGDEEDDEEDEEREREYAKRHLFGLK